MEELKNNPFMIVIIAITILMFGVIFVDKVVVDKISDKVIEKLQKEYSPARPPYGPGINEDVVHENILNF